MNCRVQIARTQNTREKMAKRKQNKYNKVRKKECEEEKKSFFNTNITILLYFQDGSKSHKLYKTQLCTLH